MFSDNETDVDLLGFEDEVHNIIDLVTDTTVLPVTAGVLADWGAGKSSLLKMVARDLRAKDVVVVEFSPWRIENYDDAKTAFLSAVVEQVAEHIPPESKTPLAQRARECLSMLRRRVRWMRVAGLAAKHMVTLTAPSLEDMDGLLKEEKEPEDQPSTESISRDFRGEFENLVAGLEGRTVVVLIDDLDRSLPEQVVDVLQATRLFLAVPDTAFVLATDERVVRDAIRVRYPQAYLTSETDLPSEYLEKIVQVAIRIPPIGPAEAESYLNLLVAQTHLGEDQMARCLQRAREIRAQGSVSVAMNLGIARDAVGGSLSDDAEREFALMGRVARLLAAGLKGNPRQMKRYLNGLEMRWNTANRRHLDLDRGVLAKLMVLEYSDPTRYKELYGWVSGSAQFMAQFGVLEKAARDAIGVVADTAADDGTRDSGQRGEVPGSAPESTSSDDPASEPADGLTGQAGPDDVPPRLRSVATTVAAEEAPSDRGETPPQTTIQRPQSGGGSETDSAAIQQPGGSGRWLESDWLLNWLALDPALNGTDLSPYFELGRAALASTVIRARALPERLQHLLQRMASNASDVRDAASDEAARLGAADASLVMDAACERLPTEDNPTNLTLAVATMAAKHPSLAPPLLHAVRSVPFDGFTAGVAQGFLRRLGDAAALPAAQEVLRMWAEQTVNRRLAASAKQALSPRR